MNTDTKKTAKPRRRWFQFSLRTLLIVVAILSVPLGWVGWKKGQVQRERATITWVKKMGGEVHIGPNREKGWWEESTDKWFGERVRSVILNNKQVSDLSPLAESKSLRFLRLDDTQVSDLSPLAEMKSLETLYLENTQVSDVSPLAELKNLKWLKLNNTQVSDLSPLAELKNLSFLLLNNTQVSDLSPLAESKKLRILYLANTQVSDEQVQELRQALPNCKIRHSIRVAK
jgi:hypothetical protein